MRKVIFWRLWLKNWNSKQVEPQANKLLPLIDSLKLITHSLTKFVRNRLKVIGVGKRAPPLPPANHT